MYHIKDKDFIRGKVPMTKEEIRAVSIAKMEISDEDVCIDIGGGTGSVSIEMARFSKNGHVYTIEQKEEAVDLIKQNMEKFEIKNMTVISGKAPEDLPQGITFDKVFIGGSGGNLSEIKCLAVGSSKTRGVDSVDSINKENIDSVVSFAKDFAQKTSSIIVITSIIDIVTDGKIAYCVYNGDKMMSRITGSGCQLSAMMAAYISVNTDNILKASLACVCAMGLCGEIAKNRMTDKDGNSSYRNYLIDAVYNLTPDELEKGARYEIR